MRNESGIGEAGHISGSTNRHEASHHHLTGTLCFRSVAVRHKHLLEYRLYCPCPMELRDFSEDGAADANLKRESRELDSTCPLNTHFGFRRHPRFVPLSVLADAEP